MSLIFILPTNQLNFILEKLKVPKTQRSWLKAAKIEILSTKNLNFQSLEKFWNKIEYMIEF